MKIAGIISEYNPFHNGHMFHIEETKRITGCDDIIAVMSGNFVQRGEPAIMDKWSRAKCALLCGADIVLELPTIFSTAGAEYFAHGAVKTLKDTEITDFLSFGSETGDIEPLKIAAQLLTDENEDFSALLKAELNKGSAFATARQNALEKVTGRDFSFLSSPNNILAVEYIKALKSLNCSIKPVTIKRRGEGYNSTCTASALASATAVRKAVLNNDINAAKNAMPYESFKILKDCIDNGTAPICFNDYFQSLSYSVRKNPSSLTDISDITEGLENRIINSFGSCGSIDEIMDFLKTKRYAYTKLQRALLHILLDITSADLKHYSKLPHMPYIRVLGFKKEKSYLLSQLTEKSSVPVVTGIKKAYSTLNADAISLLDAEKRYTDIYCMAYPSPSMRGLNKEYTNSIVIV